MFSLSNRVSTACKFLLALSLFASISACSGSDSNSEAPDPSDVTDGSDVGQGGSGGGSTPDNTTPDSQFPSSGTYDLSLYTFHRNVLSAGGQISFIEKIYGKNESEDGAFISLRRDFTNNNGTIEESSSDALIKTFTVSSTAINENLLDSGDSRESQRYANIGDVYLNANSTPDPSNPIAVEQNATCRLEEALDSFDLSTATADLMLASGVYEDVIRVFCVTGFVRGGTVTPHTMLTSYFAKDIGLIFSEGEVLFLEDVYIIEEY